MSTYETHIIKDSRLPFIFHRSQVNLAVDRHTAGNWHENIEILFFIEGEGIVYCDLKKIAIEAGDIVVVNANRVHSIISTSDRLVNHCLIVDRSFCIANSFDTNLLHFDEHFKDEEIADIFYTLEKNYFPRDMSERSIPLMRAYVLNIMGLLCAKHSSAELERGDEIRLITCVKQAIGLIRSEYYRDLSLDYVAEFAGLSKFYFAREFKRVTGYTFVSYVNVTRCENAKALLSDWALTLGRIGKKCGFSSQSYFTKTFKKYVGMLPEEYRRDYLKKSGTKQ